MATTRRLGPDRPATHSPVGNILVHCPLDATTTKTLTWLRLLPSNKLIHYIYLNWRSPTTDPASASYYPDQSHQDFHMEAHFLIRHILERPLRAALTRSSTIHLTWRAPINTARASLG